MIKIDYTVKSIEGFHARPVKSLVDYAKNFDALIDIEYNQKRVTLKSILFVLSLGIPYQANFNIYIDGIDEENIKIGIERILREERLI